MWTDLFLASWLSRVTTTVRISVSILPIHASSSWKPHGARAVAVQVVPGPKLRGNVKSLSDVRKCVCRTKKGTSIYERVNAAPNTHVLSPDIADTGTVLPRCPAGARRWPDLLMAHPTAATVLRPETATSPNTVAETSRVLLLGGQRWAR